MALAAALLAAGCNTKPAKFLCETYVAGSFTPDNHEALSIDASGWPLLDKAAAHIELAFLLANPRAQSVELVHVLNSQEIERFTLHVPASDTLVPRCVIGTTAGTSSCGAFVHVLPQPVGGYYYLRSPGDVIEAGMSFVLCR